MWVVAVIVFAWWIGDLVTLHHDPVNLLSCNFPRGTPPVVRWFIGFIIIMITSCISLIAGIAVNWTIYGIYRLLCYLARLLVTYEEKSAK
jgi:hypothetical protein